MGDDDRQIGDDHLRFESIEVEQFRGFDPPGFRIDGLSEGINVVFGPNASGKSTLAAAARRLIWPRQAERASLGARLRSGSTTWDVDIDAGRVRRYSDPAGVDFPEVPPAEHADRYHLYLHELLSATDTSFARAVQRDAAGGVDVQADAAALDFAEVAPRSGASTKAVEQAARKRRELRDQQEGLRGREGKLDELERRLDRAEEAQAQVERVEAALAFVEAERELDAAQNRVDAFADAHERLRGDENEELEQLDDACRELERACGGLEQELEEERERLAADPLPESGVSKGRVATIDNGIDKLDELERRRREKRQEVERLKARRDRASDRMTSIVDPRAVDDLEVPRLGELEEFLRREDELRADESVLEAFRREFRVDDVPDDARVEAYRTGARRLRRWLKAEATRAGADAEASGQSWGGWLMAAGGLVVLAGALSAWLIHLAALVFVVLGLAIVGLVWWRADSPGATDGEGATTEMHRREFEEGVDLAPPETWTPEAVESRLDDLEQRFAEATVERRRAEVWARKSEEFGDLDERRREVDAERERLAEELGVAPGVDRVPLAGVFRDLDQFWEAADAVAERRAELESLGDQCDDALASVAEAFREVGFEAPDSLEEAQGMLDDLRGARDERQQRRRRIDELERELERTRADLEDRRDEREAIYERLGVEQGARERVVELCRNHEAWEEARDDLRAAEQTVDVRRRDVEGFETFDEALLALTPEELDRRREELVERAEARDELSDRISAIRREIEEQRSSRELEQAHAEYRRARDELVEERREDYLRLAGHLLATRVRNRTRDRELPEVFHRARELLLAVTRGRYRLELGAGETASFRAFDVNRQERRQLDELSSGTRLQLLLAVRVAFVEKEESGLALPLVLDEAFANSDRQRANSMIETVEQFAAKGRQILYFTAQRDEVRQWRARLAGADGVDHRVLDLRRVLGGDDETPLEESNLEVDELATRRETPEPEGTHEAYGEQLGVDRWSPRQPVESLHLWYLVEDLELLRELLGAGLERWGQLRGLVEAEALGDVELPGEAWRRIRARAEAAGALAGAWRVGRGRPVDRRVLEDSGAVSENFIDEVSELAEELRGDGAAVVDALKAGEVKRFRSDKAEELEAYLEEHGFIESREPLEEGEIRTRVLRAVAEALEEGWVGREELDRLVGRLMG